jgi:hypothetical protein
LSVYDKSQTNDTPCKCCGIEFNSMYVSYLLRANLVHVKSAPSMKIHSIGFLPSVIDFFHWIFKQNFVTVIVTAAVGYLIMTMLFACAIWLVGSRRHECIGGADFSDNGDNYFTDAFSLSWTTFATVVRVVTDWRVLQLRASQS